jgi:N-acetylglucosamine-6-sulfatase
MYCEFADDEVSVLEHEQVIFIKSSFFFLQNFVELYDLSKDPHQLKNVAKSVDPQVLVGLNKRLVQLTICNGPTCKPGFRPYPPRDFSHSNIYSNEVNFHMDQNEGLQTL